MNDDLSIEDKKLLLKLARKTIDKKVNGIDDFSEDSEYEKFGFRRGVFVTLKKNDMLRGCIGNILPDRKLYEAVIENSLHSAFDDPRFPSLEAHELDECEIEISVLSVPEKVEYNNHEDLKKKIVPFEHGVILEFGLRKSTFLPQVWDELPDFESFISHLTMKAGLSPDAWMEKKPVVKVYKADHFKESDLL